MLMLLLLEQPLVDGLLEQSVRGLRWGATLRGLRALRRLLRTSSAGVTPRQARHGILLLLHLEVVVLMEPLLEGACGLLLGHRPWVTLPLRAGGTAGLLGAKRGTSRTRSLSHGRRLHPRLAHETLSLWGLRLLELTVVDSHLLPSHEQLSKLGVEVPHLWTRPPLQASSSTLLLLLLLLLESCHLLLL